jgi:hypothetical protein
MLSAALLAAVTLTLPSWRNGAPALLVDVPDGYHVQRQKGPDFDVYHISSKTSHGSLGIYVGHHPSERRHAAGQSSGRFAWRMSETGEGTTRVVSADALVEGLFGGYSGPGVADLLVHVMIRAPEAKIVERLKAGAETLRVAATRSPASGAGPQNKRMNLSKSAPASTATFAGYPQCSTHVRPAIGGA